MSAAETRRRQGAAAPVPSLSLSSIGRFLVIAITTYLGLLAVTFFIGRVIPIDPVLAVLGDRAPANVVERTRREMGLNLPLIEQFYIYVKNALNGDFGTSVLTTNPVMTDIRRAFPATIELATLGTLIGCVHRRAARRAGRGQARQHHRPDRAHHRPGRLFRADLLAGAAGAACCSTPSCNGWPFPAASTSSTNTLSRRSPASISSMRCGRGSGTCSAMSSATSSCRPRCSAISRSPISAA